MLKPSRRGNTVEVISIGNELLIGHTLDTNSNWIAKQVAKHGWTLNRVTQLRDSLTTMPQGIKEALDRKPDLLITIGGLGPTHDDMTLNGVAKALKKPMILNQNALDMIQRHYSSMERLVPLTDHRRKMAVLPRGSEPLPNAVGTAPGVMIRSGRTVIVALPGVPAEMRAIFRGSVLPLLRKSHSSPPQEAYLYLTGIIESALAPVLNHAQRKYPGLYFKSHPRGKETGTKPLIQLHIYNIDPRSKRKIRDAVAFLVRGLSRLASRHDLVSRGNRPIEAG